MRLHFGAVEHTGTTPTLLSMLTSLLKSEEPRYESAILIAAFANDAGLLRLAPYLEEFIGHGGIVKCYLGIDLRGTSIEALQRMLSLTEETYIFHNSGIPTFHPKMYIFEKTNELASLIIGSGNLTLGGLHTNYEANLRIDFQLPDDTEELVSARRLWEPIVNAPPEVLLKANAELIEKLRTRGEIVTEKQMAVQKAKQKKSLAATTATEEQIPPNPFGSVSVPVPPPVVANLLQPKTPEPAKVEVAPPLPQLRSFVVMINPIDQPNIPGEVRLPKKALDANPEFWSYPDKYTPVEETKNEYLEWYSKWRIEDFGATKTIQELDVRLYFYPGKAEFRAFTPHLRNLGGTENDILVLTPVTEDAVDFICYFIPQGTPQYEEYRARCNQSMPNSNRMWGFI